MRLTQLQYEQTLGPAGPWALCPVDLEQMHLLVGLNATGKSRTLAVIKVFSDLVLGTLPPMEGKWKLLFRHDATLYTYELLMAPGKVLRENLKVDGVVRLERHEDGIGTIHSTESPQKPLRFQIPVEDVAVKAKRDLIQHDFLEPLHEWAAGLRHYPFGSKMGQDKYLWIQGNGQPSDPRSWDLATGLFFRGFQEHREDFKEKVLSYLNRLNYQIVDIKIAAVPPLFILNEPQLSQGSLHGLAVKEHDLSGWTWQLEMSQGMFRALATVIHLAYAELASQPSCILIDDIGEGLDYERSALLIQLLMERTLETKIQLLLTTNDRFVMNAVPLDYWAVIRRTGSTCQIINHRNAPQIFADFKLTGLNNFDFLQSRFFEQAQLPPCR